MEATPSTFPHSRKTNFEKPVFRESPSREREEYQTSLKFIRDKFSPCACNRRRQTRRWNIQ